MPLFALGRRKVVWMDRFARRIRDREIARHQIERKALLARAQAMARVGKPPTREDYAVYHCYTFVQGGSPLAYEEWAATLGGKRGTGMDGAVHGVP